MIGQMLSGFRIVDKIKDGSIGTVWLATNPRGETVALKQISEKNAQLRRKIKLFKRECSLTQRLLHPGIIKVHEYVDVPPRPFFAMEYFESDSLKYAVLNRPERVAGREFSILRQVAEAVAYTHSMGITHKDLKPDNILISSTSEIRLIDFSLAQTRFDRFFQLTRRVEGTPAYMAPEQVMGRVCDERSDIFSFGAVMFELLTKRPAFTATTEKALLENRVNGSPPSMRGAVPTVSSELDELCARLMARQPADRIQDMTVVISDLAKWEKRDEAVRLRQVAQVDATTWRTKGR